MRKLGIVVVIVVLVFVIVVRAGFLSRDDAAGESSPRADSGSDPAAPSPPRADAATPNASADTGPLANVIDCLSLPDVQDPHPDWTAEEYLEQMDRTVTVLAASDDAEHVLAAAMLADAQATWMTLQDREGTGRESLVQVPADFDQLIERAVTLGPANPLVLQQAASRCLDPEGPTYCRDTAFTRNADRLLKQNGVFWAELAAHHYERGDEEAALEALDLASSVPEYSGNWLEQVMLIERALGAASNLGYFDRLSVGLGIAAMLQNAESGVVGLCLNEAVDAGVWENACIKFAERLAAEEQTALNRALGLGLLEELLRQSDNRAALEAVAAERRQLEALTQGPHVQASMRLMAADERFAASYMDEWAASGELAAMEFARREIDRRIAAAGDDACSRALREE